MQKRYTAEENAQWLASVPKKMVNVKVIIESDKGNVLLVKPDYKDTWQMPGGAVDANENPIDAAVREVKEETNIDIDPTKLRIVDPVVHKNDDDILFLIISLWNNC